MLKPEKFNKIILLDPTFFRPYIIRAWKVINFLNMQKYFLPLVIAAENKRMEFKSIEEMFKSYRKNKIFIKFNDSDLQRLVESLVEQKNEKVQLIYPANWDARIYKKGLLNDMFIWRNIEKLDVDTIIIRGGQSDVFIEKTENLVLKKNKNIKVRSIRDSDHLFPINNTLQTIDLIKDFI